ncbi:MAG TPA: gluconokinase, GntK/IdnK-type [Polyangiaceae bacterium]
MVIIISGVAGSGKTTVGSALAGRLGFTFQDADAFHSPESRAKMQAGIGLSDTDREGWLATLQQLISSHLRAKRGLVLACSALREQYREALRVDPRRVVLFVLRVSPAILAQRLRSRSEHFAGPALLGSQLVTFEEPERDPVVDGARSMAAVVYRIERRLCVLMARSRLSP